MKPDLFTRTVRSRCSSCGSGMLAWWSRSEALSLGIPVDEAEVMLGRVERVWQCHRCSEVGMFGAFVMGDDG